MKGFTQTIAVSALALLMFAAVPQTVKAADSTPVQNDAFSLTLPAGFAAFAQSSQTATTPDGTITTTNWVSKAPTGDAIIVTVSKMPKKILDADKLFTGTRDSLLKSLKATLDSEEKIAGDIPASSLLFHNDNAFLRARLAVNSETFYQVLYVGRTAEQRALPFVGQMFDSFHITAPAAAAAAPAAAAPAASAAAPAAAAPVAQATSTHH